MTNDHSARCHRSRVKTVRLGKQVGNTCVVTGKRQFETPLLAQAELDKVKLLRAKTRQSHCETKYYLCASCLKYHLSSRNR